jgi:DNA replication ATP-dependent helicase Dna2
VDSPRKLSAAQEGWRAWWPSGSATVVSVVAEERAVHINFATCDPPGEGEVVHLYPPHFLEELRELWKRPQIATVALSWLDSLNSPQCETGSRRLIPTFPWLRSAQREAFRLASQHHGFLWGPPGTGKTRTIGAMVAQYLEDFRDARILLLCNTNSAVDQAILSVDRSVDELLAQDPEPARLQGDYLRMGVHFNVNSYLGREHLLPTMDPSILLEIARLEGNRPSPSNPAAYAVWTGMLHAARKKIPRELAQARMVAITTCEAVLRFDELRSLGKFDLMVFDEASQVGRAHALALAPLARHVIFGGDPKQLSPIVQSKDQPFVRKWLNSSMFEHIGTDSATCFLDEQSRMAAPICRIVSEVFYDKKLVVAGECSETWMRDRAPAFVEGYGEAALIFPPIQTERTFSPMDGGWIRRESARVIASIVEQLLTCAEMTEDKILILTPFHAQNRLIRQIINRTRTRPIRISTVHSAQGQECHTVVFDPVNFGQDLKDRREVARLINVAISRAKACLVIPMSSGDLSSPELRRIYEIGMGKPVSKTVTEGVLLSELALKPGFPKSCVGKLVLFSQANGHNQLGTLVQGVQDQSSFFIKPCDSDRPKIRFNIAAVLKDAHQPTKRQIVTAALSNRTGIVVIPPPRNRP